MASESKIKEWFSKKKEIVFFLIILILGLIFYIQKITETTFLNEKTFWAFPIVIISALFIFLGIILENVFLINIGFALVFLGILLIEVFIIFPTFYEIREQALEYKKCEEIGVLRLNIISCLITGYEPVDKDIINVVAFWIFIIILPFAVIFAITYGLFHGIGLSEIFGEHGKTVVSIVTFATAMYGMRQFIGPYLIDLLAYGVWGIFGVLAACIITAGLRFTILKTFRETEAIRKSIASYFKLGELLLFDRIREFIRDIEEIITSSEATKLKKEDIDNYLKQLHIFKGYVEGVRNAARGTPKETECDELLKKINEVEGGLKNLLNNLSQ
ncbi:MAG: hypothetical protein QXY78_05115 [Thermoplasmata archaeon]